MKEYTTTAPVFSDSIQIVEPTDPGHADVVNAATKQLLHNTIALAARIDNLGAGEGGTNTTGMKAGVLFGTTLTAMDYHVLYHGTDSALTVQNPIDTLFMDYEKGNKPHAIILHIFCTDNTAEPMNMSVIDIPIMDAPLGDYEGSALYEREFVPTINNGGYKLHVLVNYDNTITIKLGGEQGDKPSTTGNLDVYAVTYESLENNN